MNRLLAVDEIRLDKDGFWSDMVAKAYEKMKRDEQTHERVVWYYNNRTDWDKVILHRAMRVEWKRRMEIREYWLASP